MSVCILNCINDIHPDRYVGFVKGSAPRFSSQMTPLYFFKGKIALRSLCSPYRYKYLGEEKRFRDLISNYYGKVFEY